MNSVVGMRGSDDESRSRDEGERQNIAHLVYHCSYDNIDSPPRKRTRRAQASNDGKGCSTERQFCCLEPGCTRTFTSRFKLMRHRLIHSGERRFKCSVCERRFHRKDHLKNHLKVHNPNKVIHSCELCYKTYSSLLSYRKHLALHAAEAGDLACKLCGKVFADQESIMHHLKVHTGSRTLKGPSERKFKCDQCDRSFFTKKDVKRHLVVHTGMRNFSCQFCPQRFGRKDHLVRHTKKSHGAQHPSLNTPDGAGPLESQSSISSDNLKLDILPAAPATQSSRVIQPSPGLTTGLSSNADGAIKQEQYYTPTSSSIPQTSYGSSHIMSENGDGLGRFGDATLLPVSQYLPMPHAFGSGIAHILPSSYPGTIPIATNLLPSLTADSVLPPVSGASVPAFTSPMSLDVGNPSLPHFSQAFH